MRQKILRHFLENFTEKLFLLHSGKEDRFSIFGLGVRKELEVFGDDKNILKNLNQFWQEYGKQEILENSALPFQAGLFVFLSYDLVENFENIEIKNSAPQIPKIYAVIPEQFFVVDWEENRIFFKECQEGLDITKEDVFDRLFDWIPGQARNDKKEKCSVTESDGIPAFAGMTEANNPPLPLGEGWGEGKNWQRQLSQEAYEAKIKTIQEEIVKGNTFQVNLSQKFKTEQKQSSRQIFANLDRINPTPFSAYFETPFGEILSASPERLVQLKDGVVETKPIAGTRKRGEGEEDEVLKKELHLSKKEMAEHSMIVDLERNDMGRVCKFGSVEVKDFAAVERYSHVQHLVSTIQGTLAEDKNFSDLIRAMHPGGTITGCPKHETCKIINDLELEDRGVYTGALGYINHKGDVDLNILIRTIYAHNEILETQAGGGIVLDSDSAKEYEETLHKAQAQFLAV